MTLQEAVIGVFAATFKLASFFGMWTWFTHNLFQVKIVYLPSAFATMLGAVPFLDAYFACVPATIELWFTRGSMTAVLFFLFHFLPCNIVVTEFYKEIKGYNYLIILLNDVLHCIVFCIILYLFQRWTSLSNRIIDSGWNFLFRR